MRIGALSALTGLTRDTIRFYERQGLIVSAAAIDPANTYRIYGDELPERLRMITDAREAGMSIADLKFFFHNMEQGKLGTVDMNQFLDARIKSLEQTIRRSRKFLKVLKSTRNALDVTAAISPENQNAT